MEFENLEEAQEVAEAFHDRARELREEAAAAEPGRSLMLSTLAGDYERRATGLELYVQSVRSAAVTEH